jgi:hypothetical protein
MDKRLLARLLKALMSLMELIACDSKYVAYDSGFWYACSLIADHDTRVQVIVKAAIAFINNAMDTIRYMQKNLEMKDEEISRKDMTIAVDKAKLEYLHKEHERLNEAIVVSNQKAERYLRDWEYVKNQNNTLRPDNEYHKSEIQELKSKLDYAETKASVAAKHTKILMHILADDNLVEWYQKITADIVAYHVTFDGRGIRDYIKSFGYPESEPLDISIICFVRMIMEMA